MYWFNHARTSRYLIKEDYGCLVPKIEAALMLGCYGRTLGSKRDMMAQRMPNGGRDNGCTPPPPWHALARPLGLE